MPLVRELVLKEAAPYYIIDPRPDLEEDHHLWKQLLTIAHSKDEELAKVLHGLRCGGTRIKKENKRYVLRPDIDPTGRVAWETEEDYRELRDKYLKPYSFLAIQCLKELERAEKIPPQEGVV
jgi:hypothetical protein